MPYPKPVTFTFYADDEAITAVRGWVSSAIDGGKRYVLDRNPRWPGDGAAQWAEKRQPYIAVVHDLSEVATFKMFLSLIVNQLEDDYGGPLP